MLQLLVGKAGGKGRSTQVFDEGKLPSTSGTVMSPTLPSTLYGKPRDVGHITLVNSHATHTHTHTHTSSAVNSHATHARTQDVLQVLQEYERSQAKKPSGFLFRAKNKGFQGGTCFGCNSFYTSGMGFQGHLDHCPGKHTTTVPVELYAHALEV